jgi:hypothetical protein
MTSTPSSTLAILVLPGKPKTALTPGRHRFGQRLP